MSTELFPLRIAAGKRFCNRKQERKLLAEYIKQARPTVLISPRRYGKTSLAYKVAKELQYPLCVIDLLTAYNDESICMAIIRAVSQLVSELMPINMKTVKLLEKCFSGVKVAMSSKLISLEFTAPLAKTEVVGEMLEVLQGLDKLAAKLDKVVIVFIDEFQRVLETEKGQAIQGSLRSVAQTTKNVAFLFSGSSRHMLSQAFDDSNQPLYMMCEKIFLERIAAADYVPYIQEAAKIKWGKELGEAEVAKIITLSQEHPFYVNFLCSTLWMLDNPPLSEAAVESGWQTCLFSEERRLVEELDKLTLNQRIVLKEIASSHGLREVTALPFLQQVSMASGTVIPIIKALKKRDMIYVDANKVTKVLDPLMQFFLLQ